MTIVDWQVKGEYPFRRTRPGPEQELVDWFLKQGAVQARRGERVTIFREPRLPSGFPDVVVVVWKESVASCWRCSRRSLTVPDLRVMHHLSNSGPCDLSGLKLLFSRQVECSLERLLASDMVGYRSGRWRARPLSSTFAATRIVAIEAKMHKWRAAIDQAFLNTWFAPESYILVPYVPRKAQLTGVAFSRGVGVLCKEPLAWTLAPQHETRPRSYVSWLLNEWAWKASDLLDIE